MENFHPRSIEYPPQMASRENQPMELSCEILLEAYRKGIFPMGVDGELAWFSPDPRGILPLDAFHLPHGLRRTLRSKPWEIRVDTSFEEVLRSCARRPETWIDETIIRSYMGLYRQGCAHSVEAWLNGRLAGGLYGVHIGGAFFGESMFHSITDASKVALYALVEILKAANFELLDIQWTTSHLEQFGAREISRPDYLLRLSKAVARATPFPVHGPWLWSKTDESFILLNWK